MMCTQQAWFLVHVADRTKIASNNLEIGILSNIVFRHLEHSKVKKCHWTEGAAGYEDDRRLLRIAENWREAMMRKYIVWRVRKIIRCMGNGSHSSLENGRR